MNSRLTPPLPTPAPSGSSSKSRHIKRENTEDEIKEYAETAVNELLGWYGYDKLDRREAQSLTLAHLARVRAAAAAVAAIGPSPALRRMQLVRPTAAVAVAGAVPTATTTTTAAVEMVRPRTPPSDAESTLDADITRSRLDSTGSSQSSPSRSDAVPSSGGADSQMLCCWCHQAAPPNRPFSLRTPGGQTAFFCSEVCFTQSRRASFKRSRTCDWCRHVRHSVSYVDFQDGEHQLQFCSDKCLNQYKMNLFCRETAAHLEHLPHLADTNTTGKPLITPDLWLRESDSPSPPPVESPPPSPRHPRVNHVSHTAKTRRCTRTKRPVESPPGPPHIPPAVPPPVPPPVPLPVPLTVPQAHPALPPLRPPPPSVNNLHMRPPPPHLLRLPLPRPIPPPPPPSLPPPSPSLLPPVTITVPYPIFVPIPVPIPIPIPLLLPEGGLAAVKKEAEAAANAQIKEEPSESEEVAVDADVEDDMVDEHEEAEEPPVRKRKLPPESDVKKLAKSVPA